MARLVDTSSGTGLVITIPCDARTLGKWGDKRDKRKIPIFGNFPFGNSIAIENSKARCDDLNSLAKFVRHEIARVDTDIDYRMHMLQVKATKDYFCGVSSVQIPKAAVRLGIAPAYVDTFIDFGDNPRVWFYVETVGSLTQVAVDVLLPGVDMSRVLSKLLSKEVLSSLCSTNLMPLIVKQASRPDSKKKAVVVPDVMMITFDVLQRYFLT
jgi:hypothetical protein